MKIAIVGGGIGGLATALAMTKAGLAVTVHERSEQLVDQGAGITLILTRCLTSQSSPEEAFALYQRTRGPRARLITEQTARRGDRYLGEPTADSVQGEDQGPQYAYDAVSGPLGG
jgi:glycine/D-amino acid oxidase-like deaminating enzyme